ncbi:MAG TPA: NAD+ synthase [Anaerolineales bacterium]|nr:NAD+ synthase [Anaerolineales bacterium]
MTTPPSPSLEIDPELARRILTDFIRSEIHRAGFKRGVVAVSGGLDSAVSCLLAAQALGPENVLALRMPFRTSPAASLDDAEAVIRASGVAARTFSITEAAEPLLHLVPEGDRVRRGNILARLRMIVLYDQSAEFGGLVVGTGNKTEVLLGYTTLYGDSACALNPLGDLYKTQVRQLARHLGVSESILAKPPSADLWPGQTDEGELGFTYADVDRLLFLLVDERRSPDEVVAAGFERSFVEGVLDRIRRTQYKRMQPPIAKLSNRTVGYDFLYMRDWGT